MATKRSWDRQGTRKENTNRMTAQTPVRDDRSPTSKQRDQHGEQEQEEHSTALITPTTTVSTPSKKSQPVATVALDSNPIEPSTGAASPTSAAVGIMSWTGDPYGETRYPVSSAKKKTGVVPCSDVTAPSVPADPPGDCLDEGDEERLATTGLRDAPPPSPPRDAGIPNVAPTSTPGDASNASRVKTHNSSYARDDDDGDDGDETASSFGSKQQHPVNRILEALALFPEDAEEAVDASWAVPRGEGDFNDDKDKDDRRTQPDRRRQSQSPVKDPPPALVIVRCGGDGKEEEASQPATDSSSDSSVSSFGGGGMGSSPDKCQRHRRRASDRDLEKRNDSSLDETSPISESEGASGDRELSRRVDPEQEENEQVTETGHAAPPSRSPDTFTPPEVEASACRDRESSPSAAVADGASELALNPSTIVRRPDQESAPRRHRRQECLDDDDELDALVRELDASGSDDDDNSNSYERNGTHPLRAVPTAGGSRIHRRCRSGRRGSRPRRKKGAGAIPSSNKKGQGRTRTRTVVVRYADTSREASETSVSDYTSDDSDDIEGRASAFPHDPVVQALFRMMSPAPPAPEEADSSGESSLEGTRGCLAPSTDKPSRPLPDGGPPREDPSAFPELVRDLWKSCTFDPFCDGKPSSTPQAMDRQTDQPQWEQPQSEQPQTEQPLMEQQQAEPKPQALQLRQEGDTENASFESNNDEQSNSGKAEGGNLNLMDFIDASFFYELWTLASLQLCDVASSGFDSTSFGQSQSMTSRHVASEGTTTPPDSLSLDPNELYAKDATGPSNPVDHPRLLAECLSRGGGGSPLAQHRAALILEQCKKRFPTLYERIIGRLDARSSGDKTGGVRRRRAMPTKLPQGMVKNVSDGTLFSEHNADGRTNADIGNKTPRIRNTSLHPSQLPQGLGGVPESAGIAQAYTVDLFTSTPEKEQGSKASEFSADSSKLMITVASATVLPDISRSASSKPFHLRPNAVDQASNLEDRFPFLSSSTEHPHPGHNLDYEFHSVEEVTSPDSIPYPASMYSPAFTATNELSPNGQQDCQSSRASFEQMNNENEADPDGNSSLRDSVTGKSYGAEPKHQSDESTAELYEEGIEVKIDNILSDLDCSDEKKCSDGERPSALDDSLSIVEKAAGFPGQTSPRRHRSVPRLRGNHIHAVKVNSIESNGKVQERAVTLETQFSGGQVHRRAKAPVDAEKRRSIWTTLRPSKRPERSGSVGTNNRMDSFKNAKAAPTSIPSALRVHNLADSQKMSRKDESQYQTLHDEIRPVPDSGRFSPSSFPSLFQRTRDDVATESQWTSQYIPSDAFADTRNVDDIASASIIDEATEMLSFSGRAKKRNVSPSRMRRSSSLPNSTLPLPNKKVYDLSATSWVKLNTPTRPSSRENLERSSTIEPYGVAVSERVAWWDKRPSPKPSTAKRENDDRTCHVGTQSELSQNQNQMWLSQAEAFTRARHERKLQGSPPRFQRLNSRNTRREATPLLNGEPLYCVN